jgi:transposase
MGMFAGLDVGGKKTAVCVVDRAGKIVWQGMVDTHPEMIAAALKRWQGMLEKVGLESGPFTPHLHRALVAMGYPMVCMDARRAADAIKSRRIKSDKADAWALAEMLRTGWFTAVHVKSIDSHRIKTLLGARDQLVKVKRSLGNQVRGLLRTFGIRLPSRVGTKRFAEAAHEATQNDDLMHASIGALLEALVSIDAQVGKLDGELKEIAGRNEVAWRLMSTPSIGPVTVLAYMAAIEDPHRFGRTRDIGAYLGLTEKRYQSAETDIRMGISKQGDAMARHYLYEAANVLLTTVKKRFALRSWGLQLMKKIGPKRARVAVARKLAVLLGRMWKDGTHFEAAMPVAA